MGNRFSFVVSILTLLLASHVSYGQSKLPAETFPTYRQIKPADSEIIDHVSPGGDAYTMSRKEAINLFDYPKNTVTYLLNQGFLIKMGK